MVRSILYSIGSITPPISLAKGYISILKDIILYNETIYLGHSSIQIWLFVPKSCNISLFINNWTNTNVVLIFINTLWFITSYSLGASTYDSDRKNILFHKLDKNLGFCWLGLSQNPFGWLEKISKVKNNASNISRI